MISGRTTFAEAFPPSTTPVVARPAVFKKSSLDTFIAMIFAIMSG
jgi:hypothetical protein